MGRRTKMIKVTNESQALKNLRVMRGLSVRKLADLIGISHTLVSHLELGRANIQKSYIEKFLEALDLSWDDWTIVTTGGKKAKSQARTKVTEECLKRTFRR